MGLHFVLSLASAKVNKTIDQGIELIKRTYLLMELR